MNIFAPTDAPLKVSVLVLPGSSIMSVACTLDPMRATNRLVDKNIFDWTIHTLDGASALLSCDLPLSADSKFSSDVGGDILMIIAGFDSDLYAGKNAVPRIVRAAQQYDAVVGVEAGAWLLARAGLLNGRKATTHWEDLEDFTNNHSKIDVIPDRYVIDGKFVTTGGASPTFDLMLHLIRSRLGVGFAMEVAGAFIYDEAHAPTEAQMLVSLGHLNTFEPRVAEAIRYMESRIDEPVSVARIAREMRLSVRMLENLFLRALNVSPGKYYRDLRLQVARRLAVDTKLSIQEIAVRTGFNSLSAFSRSYKSSFGVSPTQSRNMS
ncbi:MAG: GlxA family transcriptional regulator [Paracoccaceae bacterium]|jgi:transcriptional regulator GlxA family with amidase domain